FPLFMFLTGRYPWPDLKATGLVFSGLAGVAGAVGAIGVIFATQTARAAAPPDNPDLYRLFIAPLIFGLAPLINTLVSTVWPPKPGRPFHFEVDLPGWKLWVGIVLVGIGSALVLFSKEEAEVSKSKAAKKPAPAVAAAPSPNIQEAPQ